MNLSNPVAAPGSAADQEFAAQAAQAGLVLPPRRKLNPGLAAGLAGVILAASLGIGWAGHGFNPFVRPGPPTLPSSCTTPAFQYFGEISPALDPAQADAYHRFARGFSNWSAGCITVTLNSSPAGNDLGSLAAGKVDFAIPGAPPSLPAIKTLPYPAALVPETVGAVTLAYNLPSSFGPLNLSAGILSGICLGAIRTWNDPAIRAINPGAAHVGPARILTEFLSGPSSTTASLTSYLSAANQSWRQAIGTPSNVTWSHDRLFNGTTPLLQYVQGTPGALGVVPESVPVPAGVAEARLANVAGHYASPNATGIAAAAGAAAEALLAKANLSADPVPSAVNATGNWSYPLTTFSSVVLYLDLAKAYGNKPGWTATWWLLQFFEWVATNGARSEIAAGLSPAPYPVVALGQSVLQQVSYDGASILIGGTEGETGETGGETGAF